MPRRDMGMAAIAPMAWTPGYAVLMFFMWWIMMMAMMLPSATPMILLFALINRKQREHGAPYVPTGIFAAGYLLVWGAFSLRCGHRPVGPGADRAVVLDAGQHQRAARRRAPDRRGGYQLSPLKHACLRHCRSPSSSSVTLASGQHGRAAHGSRARRVLHRLLLVPDGAAVLRRH